MRTEPRCGASSPATMRRSVVLPAPLGPPSHVTVPGARASDAPPRTTRAPQRRCTSSTISGQPVGTGESMRASRRARESTRALARPLDGNAPEREPALELGLGGQLVDHLRLDL